ncbi:MAG: efflux RND transporter periplasmic adaptor subunit [Flavobacteriales bacterium]|nr:efflux RND transporter periplasmic adaptor subunit [Flavobacteriales bacterium]MCB9192016.1 efflux RND transporter periplasmic adaptor subunit [Flavobacteriales bacterium]MCB9205036.1 efflux RND transporter periplasmic adaptor subunit [Flavobacteriales bacterium]
MYRPFVMIGLIASIALTSCHSEKHHHHEEETEFLVTSPVRMDTVVTKDYVCQIRSSQHIELRALESGYLEEIFVDEGQYVRKGQKMFQIMPRLYQAELQKAQAEVDFAQIEYNNTKVLTDSNIVSANELALAKANLDKAKAEMMLAEVHLGFAEIKAPFDGIMDRFHVRLGSLLEEGELLTELSDNSEMWVYFNVPEAEYLDYMKKSKAGNGTKVRLRMANGEEFNYSGTISAIEADFDSKTGNIAFRATFPNKERLLRHGETGNILMDSELKDALLIPQKATFEVLDQRYVFVIDNEGVVRMTRIEVAAELEHLFVISDGISENDHILLEGLRKVKNEQEIKTKFLKPDSVLTHLELYAE